MTDGDRSLFRKVDCVRLAVTGLDAALALYRDALGHALVWRTPTSAGLAMPGTDAELVLTTEVEAMEVDLLVASADDAARRFVAAGGTVAAGPFDIAIGRCAVVRDPWGNVLVLLDGSKRKLLTDAEANVTGVG